MDVADTLSYYERAGRRYAALIGPEPDPLRERALSRFLARVEPGCEVLEIGSGAGRDADHLEAHGLAVRRTDAVRSFAEIQAERGKEVSQLNVVTDPLGGPYGGVLAMCVLMHVPIRDIDDVVCRIAAALRPGAPFLLSVREGVGIAPPPAAMQFWTREDFADVLEGAGLIIEWFERQVYAEDDEWLTYLATRPVTPTSSARAGRSRPRDR